MRKKSTKPTAGIEGPSARGVVGVLARLHKSYPEAFGQSDETRLGTGFLTLDTALGGGIVEGRIVEVFGGESSGKSSLAIRLAGRATGVGEVALVCDYEHAFDPEYAARVSQLEVVHLSDSEAWFRSHGVKHPGVLLWFQPMNLEEGTDLAFSLSEAFGPRLRVVINDSLTAMTPRKILEGTSDEPNVGLQARLLGTFYSKGSKLFHRHRTSLIVVNQMRMKIAMGWGQQSGETSAGGLATKFYASQRIQMTSGESSAWRSYLPQGSHVSYLVIRKNKTSPQRKGKTTLVFRPNFGLSHEIELLDLCIQHKVLAPGGAGRYTFRGVDCTRQELVDLLTTNERRHALIVALAEALRAAVPDGEFRFEDTKDP